VGTAASFGEAGVVGPVALFVERRVAYLSAFEIIPGLDLGALQWQPFHPVFYRASVARGAIFLTILGAAVDLVSSAGDKSMTTVAWLVFGVAAMLVAIRLASLFLARPENGFAMTEDALVTRRGYFTQSISAMPIERMENVAISQPWWWKNRRAANLVAQAMRQKIHAGSLPESAIEELTARWVAKIESGKNQRLYLVSGEAPESNV
jgi:membrane protein YdbS with pleckstrin-like domain